MNFWCQNLQEVEFLMKTVRARNLWPSTSLCWVVRFKTTDYRKLPGGSPGQSEDSGGKGDPEARGDKVEEY